MQPGVVEGYYGKPFKVRHRRILFKYISMLDNAGYVYAPKNDLFHRLRWREDYPDDEWAPISESIDASVKAGVEFIFGISPWQFNPGESCLLRRKALRAVDAGAAGIAVLFDDIPEKTDEYLAVSQLHLAEEALKGLDCKIYLCPSIYCVELLERYDGGAYLKAWRNGIRSDWKSFWTGDDVIAKEFCEDSLTRAGKMLGGKPVIWDNLLADDYCLRRIYLADLDGRIPEGYSYFLNPSSCFPVALHSVYMLLKASGISCGWPSELGSIEEAWKILSGFHHLPWSAGEETECLLADLTEAASGGSSGQLADKLRSMYLILGRFIDSIDEIDDGIELMPYAADVKKIISWWQEALLLSSRSERISRLRYLMFERLPFDHPLSMITAKASMNNGKGER